MVDLTNLTDEELFKLYHEETDEVIKDDIYNQIFLNNKKFFFYLAKKYKHRDFHTEDVVSLAKLGMAKAFRSYNPETGFKLSTYAYRIMINEILQQFRRVEYKKFSVSIYEPVFIEKADDTILLDTIACKEVPFNVMLEQQDFINNVMNIMKEKLDEREFRVFMNKLSDNPKTQRELSKEFNVSQAYVSRIEKNILKRVRNLFSKEVAI